MIIYKRNFDENLNRLIYILIKKENVFVKYMDILEKVRNIIKFMYSELIYSKKNLKAEEKKNKHKGGFQCLYAPITLTDSTFRKDIILKGF